MTPLVSRIRIDDWLAGDTLVVGLRGDLDAAACQEVAEHLRELAAYRVGVRLTLDLGGVRSVDADAAEDLFLQIVGVHARRAIITFCGAHGGVQAVLARLGISAQAAAGVERIGMGRFVAGVTA